MVGKSQNCQQFVHVEANLIYNIAWVVKTGLFKYDTQRLKKPYTKILLEVYYDTNIEYCDTEIEPKTVPLSGEDLSN